MHTRSTMREHVIRRNKNAIKNIWHLTYGAVSLPRDGIDLQTEFFDVIISSVMAACMWDEISRGVFAYLLSIETSQRRYPRPN